MNQDFKLLSICIPTYNGSKYIRKNLDEIVNQIISYKLNYIEVIISDNCSTDNTYEIIKEYSNKYPNLISINRNNINLGYDGNVLKLCSLSKGKYIHIFGDDDFYAPSGLKRLCETLLKYPELSVCILSNYYLQNSNFGNIVSRKGLQDQFYIDDRIYINDSDNFIIDIEDRAWPNTNIVYRRDYYEQIPNLKEFIKKDWIHIYIMLYIAAKWQNCYIFADKYPIVIDRVDVQTWLNNIDGPRIYFNNLWVYSFTNKLGYSPKVFEWYRKKLLSEYIKNVQYRRSHSFRINVNYLLKYFPYYKDCTKFYFQFCNKFLNIMQSIFSVRNKHLKNGQIKEKILNIFNFEYRLSLKRINKKIIFLHKFTDNDYIETSNERGHFKQFVRGNVYLEMLHWLNLNPQKGSEFTTFYNSLQRKINKKIIPYHIYLDDCKKFSKYYRKTNSINLTKKQKENQ